MAANIVLLLPQSTFRKMFRQKDLEILRRSGNVIGPVDLSDAPAIEKAVADADVLVSGWGTPALSDHLLAKATRLRLLAHTAGSVKHLATEALYSRGVKVTTSAAANAVPVAHYTLAAMVMLLKQAPWLSDAYIRNDRAEVEKRKALARELQDMTVSIIGASRVGREVIKLLHAYPDLEVICYDPYLTDAAARQLGVRKVSLDEACRCELVSIHAPNIAETRHMFNARTLGLLPDHAVLINTSRGALIDEEALVAEVRKRPLYCLLDVTDPEPPAPVSPLRHEKNILITPHIAGAMNQGCKTMGRYTIDEIARFLRGEKLQTDITREMLATQA